ncbi:MAG: hypothetical protein MZU84_06925 [Sphingobacterium sp.]|nr:hypothetical protein [Sphingobacterium sp.]
MIIGKLAGQYAIHGRHLRPGAARRIGNTRRKRFLGNEEACSGPHRQCACFEALFEQVLLDSLFKPRGETEIDMSESAPAGNEA